MNAIEFMIVVSIALLSTDLVYHQFAIAQEPSLSERELGKIEGKMELLCKQNNGPWSELPEFWEKMCSPENLKNLTNELGNITNNTEVK